MVKILDATLREGEQTKGVSFSLRQKKMIAKALDSIGVDCIEAGHPYISGYDFRCVRAVATLGLRAEVLGHARAKKEDIDAVFKSGCHWVGIFCGINGLSRENKLGGRSKHEVLTIIREAIQYAKSLGLKVRYSVEDATRTSVKDLLEVGHIAEEAGADRLGIPDTVGTMTPEKMRRLVKCLKRRLSLDLEVHCHNDLGLALANSLAAYRAGASVVDVSVNGLGERAGLTSLAEFCIAIQEIYGEDKLDISGLLGLSRLVEHHSGISMDSLRPIVGDNAFTHTAKLHVDAVRKDPRCYELLDPVALCGKRDLAWRKQR